MKPITFKQQNANLLKPYDMTDEECAPLPVHMDGTWIVSCWKMSLKDKLKSLLHGKIWLYVHAEHTHPPVVLVCNRTVFDREGEK